MFNVIHLVIATVIVGIGLNILAAMGIHPVTVGSWLGMIAFILELSRTDNKWM